MQRLSDGTGRRACVALVARSSILQPTLRTEDDGAVRPEGIPASGGGEDDSGNASTCKCGNEMVSGDSGPFRVRSSVSERTATFWKCSSCGRIYNERPGSLS